MLLKFPDNFYWGTATSAYQVEGGIRNNWSIAGEKFDAGVACDHYHRFEEDFDLAKAMNNNAHRFSIEWARIEPTEGRFNEAEIEHYRQIFLALRKRGLEPFVTLHHFTLPNWFNEKKHWLDIGAPQYFARFAEKMAREYKDLVKFWITINEPNIYTTHSFLRGDWPPFKKSFYITQQVVGALIESHKKSYEIIHKIIPGAQVGIASFNTHYGGILKLFSDYYWNHQFLQSIKNYQDFIGLNYYLSHYLFSLLKLSNKEKTDMGWEIRPKEIQYVLGALKQYNKPVYITENGIADARDEKRENFIKSHLEGVHRAISEGVDVRGYFYWSLLDNFEWDKGFEPRFGLVEIDYKTLKRVPRPSSIKYAEICKNNSIKI